MGSSKVFVTLSFISIVGCADSRPEAVVVNVYRPQLWLTIIDLATESNDEFSTFLPHTNSLQFLSQPGIRPDTVEAPAVGDPDTSTSPAIPIETFPFEPFTENSSSCCPFCRCTTGVASTCELPGGAWVVVALIAAVARAPAVSMIFHDAKIRTMPRTSVRTAGPKLSVPQGALPISYRPRLPLRPGHSGLGTRLRTPLRSSAARAGRALIRIHVTGNMSQFFLEQITAIMRVLP